MLNLQTHVNIYFSQAREDERTQELLIFSALFIFIVGQCLREKYRTKTTKTPRGGEGGASTKAAEE